ncbi:LysE family translocator [Paracoccus sp. T5]|uniref:LysE family translocator n=1 Tax=Paracoccus sp. T5 TaxID=3402161 RepID=UPI003AE3A168
MEILSYATALALVAAAPGPIVAILLARALAGQQRAAALFAGGVILGKLATLVAVMSGLFLWLGNPLVVILIAKAAVAGYLGVMVLRLWRHADGRLALAVPRGASSWAAELAAGVAAGLASPLSLLFFVTLFSAGSVQQQDGWPPMLIIALVTVVAPGAVFGAYVMLACRMQRLLVRADFTRRFQRVMAVLLGCTTLWLVAG